MAFFTQLAFSNTSSRCEGFCNMFNDNRPFLRSKTHYFQNEGKSKTFLVKWVLFV